MKVVITTLYADYGIPVGYELTATRGRYSFSRKYAMADWDEWTVEGFEKEAADKLDAMRVKP